MKILKKFDFREIWEIFSQKTIFNFLISFSPKENIIYIYVFTLTSVFILILILPSYKLSLIYIQFILQLNIYIHSNHCI
ncbi:hypothetical protein DGI_3377 [Megalodesulfovibrio gigas DSM 1382 = ATCC 19364]|uniref:Uncharacterized protein n=1 Tax=Megalodesulfovibrio gigas (strain ATCC 19364 / DSM 1382 / NCIMB 9332 / VKM B-1759) TaxID=1121448 RepID=T2GC21_MEGG1|nr:hypothetical protein DGI_2086 [Megalodesulfovibrio gigas DSM 1382 = ATCC 19364]AGW15066.1 hypothetical protein DGI_3377 [Megalodesulfovibrio gigas DSM 1382 = ATCC 19364]